MSGTHHAPGTCPARAVFANKYASLLDGREPEIEYVEITPRLHPRLCRDCAYISPDMCRHCADIVPPLARSVLVQRLHLSPKAVICLKNGRERGKAGKAAKVKGGCRGVCSVKGVRVYEEGMHGPVHGSAVLF